MNVDFRSFTEQVTWAKVQPGDWIYTTPDAIKAKERGVFLVDTERPQHEKGKARKVTNNVKVAAKYGPGGQLLDSGGRYLVFHDATQTSTRSGTAAAYRYLLNDSGNPMPTPSYPECPVCGSDGPACSTNNGSVAAQWHATRPTSQTPQARTDEEINLALAGEPEDIGDRCHKCKGYGVVRKLGSHKGDPYKTLNGSVEATANNNSMPCPTCKGEAIIPAA